ncbi:MAG: hypothetical protein MZU91_01840 [Desulfosudis oleivorans]|nr:hypothetical protein [Desulfosudis oleivorans]
MLGIAGITQFIEVHDTVDEAVTSLQQKNVPKALTSLRDVHLFVHDFTRTG